MKKQALTLLMATALLGAFGTTVLSAQGMGHKKQVKPFLIQGKLPHLTMMVKIMWDDADVALTKKQKERLLAVRKETMREVKALKPKIMKLETEIVNASMQGEKPATLQKKVQHLADMRAQATMVHLRCIYQTRAILTPEQLKIVE